MNFQAVSVAQKLIENGVKGGYLDAAGTPSDAVLSNIQFVDDSIGEMVAELKHRGLLESTLIIITAKHGQSPIDPNLFFPIPGHHTTNGLSPATLISNQLHAAMPPSEDPNGSGIGSTEDDVSLLWLTNPSYTDAAVALLEANLKTIGAGQIFYGPSCRAELQPPGWSTARRSAHAGHHCDAERGRDLHRQRGKAGRARRLRARRHQRDAAGLASVLSGPAPCSAKWERCRWRLRS